MRRHRDPVCAGLRMLSACLLLPLLACGGLNPANVALERFDPDYGYRPRTGGRHDPGEVLVYLAFSGGSVSPETIASSYLV